MSQFDDIEKQINERLRKINASALVAVSDSIIRKTPVDTGIAKSSWFFAIGQPSNDKSESTRDSLGAMRVEVQPMKVGEAGYFVNNLPYILGLEYGASDQSPNGMVRLSVSNWQSYVNKAARAIK
ncbi:hypothetical protein [Vibrio casei]|uniref:hypothetical protein n=1 Tax=Vibrio casei TaxID=673372 RepID=UPI003F9A5390